MTTLEGNKLIAAFMDFDSNGFTVTEEAEFPYERKGTAEDLEYHSSWDWLMPVVEKIALIAEYYSGYREEIYDKCGVVLSLHVCVSITTVWEKVIEFIQWYNTQSK